MLRKRRAMNRPIDGFNKTHESSTRTIGSGSRASRIIHRLGITTLDRTQNDSAVRTVMDGEGLNGHDFHRLESMESQKPDPTIWTTVERLEGDTPEVGSSDIKPGMKKTVWNVRK
jgi:hypothetical protein